MGGEGNTSDGLTNCQTSSFLALLLARPEEKNMRFFLKHFSFSQHYVYISLPRAPYFQAAYPGVGLSWLQAPTFHLPAAPRSC